LIELINISKRFPGNRHNTLTGANWDLREGEIHALLGENGAGKSTLMHIPAGFVKPDTGQIKLHGAITRIDGPSAARKKGIGMVRQRPEVCPGVAVWEHCVLGMDGFWFRPAVLRKKAAAVAARFAIDLPLDAQTDTLNDAGRHKAAVLAVLLSGARCLILDEPGAVLNKAENAALDRLFPALAAQGFSIALITHKLDEALRIAGRITVMRNGRIIETRPAAAWTRTELEERMFGRFDKEHQAAVCQKNTCLEPPALSVSNLNAGILNTVEFSVHCGEIVGIAGQKSDGIETLEMAICGYNMPDSGMITVLGRNTAGDMRAFRQAGGAYVAAGLRRTDGAAGGRQPSLSIAGFDRSLSLYDNLIIHHHAESAGGAVFMNKKKLNGLVRGILEKARIKVRPKRKLGILSGGMLQRLVLERELESAGGFLVISQALWGLDIEQRRRLGRKIKDAAADGIGILLFASTLEDLSELCRRLFVLEKGCLYAVDEGLCRG
jgi:simple sugar transport system ATP-binding protein